MTTEVGGPSARTRIWTWVWLGLGGLVLAFVVWSALGGPGLDRDTPQSPPLPVPNGYDEVLEAGRAIEKSETIGAKVDLVKADAAVLGPIVEANREAIALARKGLDKPIQVPVVYHMEYLMNVMMRDMGSIRAGVVRGLTAEGRLAALQGRIDESADCFADQIRLGAALGRRLPMLGYHVGLAVQSVGLHNLRDIRDKLGAKQSRQLIAFLEEIDRKRERADDVAAREGQFMNANVRSMGLLARISMKVTGLPAKDLAQARAILESSEKRQNAARRLLLTDLAVRVYREEHGEDPPDLNALVPSVLKAVPIDPYSDRPLRYQKRGKTGIVYSLGPDRDDDKLSKTVNQRHLDTDDGDYTIDSF
jgi:hypothetical protein